MQAYFNSMGLFSEFTFLELTSLRTDIEQPQFLAISPCEISCVQTGRHSPNMTTEKKPNLTKAYNSEDSHVDIHYTTRLESVGMVHVSGARCMPSIDWNLLPSPRSAMRGLFDATLAWSFTSGPILRTAGCRMKLMLGSQTIGAQERNLCTHFPRLASDAS